MCTDRVCYREGQISMASSVWCFRCWMRRLLLACRRDGYRGIARLPIDDSILCYFLLFQWTPISDCAYFQYRRGYKVDSQQNKHSQLLISIDIQTMPLLLNFIRSTYNLNIFTLNFEKNMVFQFPRSPSPLSSLIAIYGR
jgi:hypothetical protein